MEDLYYGLIRRQPVVLEDAAFEALRRSVLFLGNHQTAIESLLFSIVAGAARAALRDHRQGRAPPDLAG